MSAIGRAAIISASVAMLVVLAAGNAKSADEARLPKPRPLLPGEAGEPPAVESLSTALIHGDAAPLPRARPSIEPSAEIVDWAEGAQSRFRDAATAEEIAKATPEAALAAIDLLAPLPRPRPSTAPVLAMMVPPRIERGSVLVAPEDPDCLDRLKTLGVEFIEEPPMDLDGSCPVPHPLKVTKLGAGVAIGPETILNCAETESLSRWVTEVVVPSARRLLGAAPVQVIHDSAYVCRTRYNDPNQKVSEHAHANAIDIAAFGFAGREPIEVGGSEAGSVEAKFEAEIRAGSCTYFTTVLGPGSNAAHATHFHLDMAFRRGGYRLCELGGPSTVAAPANTKRE